MPRIARLFRTPVIPEQEPPVAARVVGDEFTPVDLNEAIKFLYLFHAENPDGGSLPDRISQVAIEIERTGTYVHTAEELAFGARVAWRNSGRCIGRLYWKSLVVRDCRGVQDPYEIFSECVEHLRHATNEGKIRPTITIFALPAPGRRGVRIRNDQMIRYAGYRAVDGSVIGDPAQVEFTRAVERFGWLGEGSAFDVLPLVIDGPTGPPHVFEIPHDAILEVPIEHPQHPWFAEPDIGGTNQDQSPGTVRPAFSSRSRCMRKRSDSVWWSVIVTPAIVNECSTATLSSSSARSFHSVRSVLVSSPRRRAMPGSRS
jgi:hypothetical protein